jgi:hypothetical protein
MNYSTTAILLDQETQILALIAALREIERIGNDPATKNPVALATIAHAAIDKWENP